MVLLPSPSWGDLRLNGGQPRLAAARGGPCAPCSAHQRL